MQKKERRKTNYIRKRKRKGKRKKRNGVGERPSEVTAKEALELTGGPGGGLEANHG
jgi:hypothetical protein